MAIETHALTKRFGVVAAVTDLDLRVERGEVYGFLGRNGAGKTTTIRALLGMVVPDSGTVRVLGQPVVRGQGPWSRVGSLVEAAVAWPELTVVQNLRTLADLHGLSKTAIDGLVDSLALTEFAERKAGHLSQGNLQRLALAMALLPDPELLILDEPINGLDPAGVVEVRELLISRSTEKGTTIFVSSHRLDEVGRTATRLGILHEGRLVEEWNASDLGRRQERRLLVGTGDQAAAADLLRRAGLKVSPGPTASTLDLGTAAPETVASLLVAAGVALHHLAVESDDLEARFLKLTGGLL